MALRRIVIVGGGISGLTAAYHLTRGPRPPQVTVLEAGAAPGGWVGSAAIAGYRVDTGPEALLARMPAVQALLADLGLDEARRAPQGSAFIWARGALRPLPQSSVFGVPNKLMPLLRSGLVGPLGVLRAGADLVLPRPRRLPPDPTIAQVLLPRFGSQVFANMIEPLLGGVHAGDARRLSVRSAVPEVAAAVSGRRSIYLALRGREPRTGSGPALIGFEGGIEQLVSAVAQAVRAVPSAEIRCGTRVWRLDPLSPGGYRVTTEQGAELLADDVVLAVPAPVAAALLAETAPDAAAAAAAIPHIGVATLVLAYAPSQIANPLAGTGFLVPPADGRLLVGCTWLTSKWAHLRPADGAPEKVLIRCMVGRDGQQSWQDLDDEALLAAVRRELAESMGIHEPPEAVSIRRMPGAMPQYVAGHADRVAAIDAALVHRPGLHVIGSSFRGVGMASCITHAGLLAARMTSSMTAPNTTPSPDSPVVAHRGTR